MRSLLAPVLLRLLGTRFVQESIETFCFVQHDSLPISGWDLEWNAAAAAAVMAGENLFDRILSVLHALLSNTWASWLKQKPSKANSRPPREVPPFDKEITHRMQVNNIPYYQQTCHDKALCFCTCLILANILNYFHLAYHAFFII